MKKIISKILATLVLLTIPFVVNAASAQVEMSNFTLTPGAQTQVSLKLTGISGTARGLQTEIVLPSGLSFVTGSNGKYAAMASAYSSGFQITSNLSGSTLKIAAFGASTDKQFVAGDVITVTVKAASSFSGGTIKINNTIVAFADGTEYSSPSASCTVSSKIPVTSVSLNKTATSIKRGSSDKLTATVNPSNATVKTVTWSSSNTAVATVASDGTVTAVKIGSAKITATCDGKSATCTVTVTAPDPTGVALNKSTLSLKATESAQLSATVTPADAAQTVTWKSSDAAIATVDANGMVTAVKVGKATITATCGSVSATCEVSVVETPATSITLDKTSASLKATESVQLTATVGPETATDKTVTWKSSDESVATVDTNGMVTAVKVGKATITATCGSVSATCEVTVVETPATSVEINLGEGVKPELKVGESFNLSVTILPESTTDKSVTWTSSDNNVVTVDKDGKVTAVGVGTATITVTTASGVTSTIKVTVVETPAASIELNYTEKSINITETLQLIAQVLPETTTDKTVTWESSRAEVASVDNNGLVTALRGGKATITARCADIEAMCVITVTSYITTIAIDPAELTIDENDSYKLNLVYTPEAATNLDLEWKSSDPAIVTVDKDGNLKALAPGSATITVTEFASELSATCNVTVNKVNFGDANGDGTVDDSDVKATTDHILRRDPEGFDEKAADSNKDGKIDVGDIVSTKNQVDNPDAPAESKERLVAPDTDGLQMDNTVTLDKEGYGEIPVTMNSSIDLAGVQADIVVPEYLVIDDIRLTDDRYNLDFEKLDDNTVRVIITSKDGSPIDFSNPLFYISVHGELGEDWASIEGTIIIKNVIGATPDGQAVDYGDTEATVKFLESSGISDAEIEGTTIVAVNGGLRVITASGNTISIFNTAGKTICTFTATGDDTRALAGGVYIVNVNGHSVKLLVK